MSSESFDKLVEILRPWLTVNAMKAFARSPAGPIIPEIRFHCLIRYLAGGSYLDICTHLYACINSLFNILLQSLEDM
jgi:hypothetical protein